MFGIVGLLLVPVGIAWLIVEVRARSTGSPAAGVWSSRLAWVALVAVTVVGGIVALATFPSTPVAGVILVLVGGYAFARAVASLRRSDDGDRDRLNPAPLYLVIVPLIVTSAQLVFHAPAVGAARGIAMEHAAQLIAEIERDRETTGRYPVSLVAVWPDYRTGVVGVRRYEYEPSGDAYNLSFEQFRLIRSAPGSSSWTTPATATRWSVMPLGG